MMWALFMQRLGFDDCWLMRPAYCWHRLRVDLELMTFSSRRGGVRGSFYNMTPLLQRRRVHCVAESNLGFEERAKLVTRSASFFVPSKLFARSGAGGGRGPSAEARRFFFSMMLRRLPEIACM